MLELHRDKRRPDRYHLWSAAGECYVRRGAHLEDVRAHLHAEALAAADAALDDMLAEAHEHH